MKDNLEFFALAEVVSSCLQEIAQRFARSPASYLFEAEIQGELFVLLRERLGDERCIHLKAREFVDQVPGRQFDVVRAEYPSSVRFDLALVAGPLSDSRTLWMQQPRIGIELKLWNFDGTGGGIDGDLEKLESYGRGVVDDTFSGLACLFIQPGLPTERWLPASAIGSSVNAPIVPAKGSRGYVIRRDTGAESALIQEYVRVVRR